MSGEHAPSERLPVLALAVGPRDPSRPTLGLFGGVHGLEQIGTHAVLAFLESLASQYEWDQDLRHWLEEFRLVSIPVVIRTGRPGAFLPLTLEMGSWMWIRKNPVQLFSSLGIFNPVKPHRYSRTMRRHLPLLHFLLRATRNSEAWAPPL